MHSAQRGNSRFEDNMIGIVPQILVWLLCFSVLGSATISFAASDLTLFGPKRYERTQGKPWVFTDTFNGCANFAGQARIRVQNGDSKESSLSSAVIGLNGTDVFTEADFKNQILSLEKTVTLHPGSNTLTTQLKSSGQKETPFLVIEILGSGCDSTPPVISVPQPTEGALLNNARPTISASYNDNIGGAGIDPASVRITLDDSDITTLCSITASGVSCTLSGNLREGAHAVTLSVADLLQNQSTLNWRFNTDTIAPFAAITTPINNRYLNASSITVTGTIDDPTATVTVNGKTAIISDALFSVADLPLLEGNNILTVTAIDRAGNKSTSTITVNLDSTPPAAPLLDPLTSPTRTATTTVSGRAEPLSTVKVFKNSQSIDTLTADAAGLFSIASITLAEGNNPFSATAIDAAGNTSPLSTPLNVVLDTVPPVITVTAPQSGALVNAAQVTITGTLDEALSSLTINGASAPLSNLSFEYVMTLAAGDNSALITATDLAGNIATTTVTVQRDSTPPKVSIISPLNGVLTSTSQIQVSGTVDDAEATLTVGGTAVSVTNKTFNVAYTLFDGDNSIQVKAIDKAGNEGTAAVTVTLDAQAPVVTLNVPATATAGTDVQITVNAIDNRVVTLVDLSADGASLWSAAPSAATASQSISYRLSPTLSPGAAVTVRGRAVDVAGNSGIATAVITIDKGADGPGWLQGKVLDDSRGLPLAGAQVSVTDAKGVQQSITSTADGAWFFELASGAATVEVTQSGFTTVRRDVTVRPGQRTSVLDSRLTRIDGTVRLVDAAGGVAKSTPFKIQNSSFTIDVQIPVNALSTQADVRLTPVSNQGLITPLPLGWSPLAVVELGLLDPVTAVPIDLQPLTAPATLTLPLPAGLSDSALTAELARYDNSRRRWLAVAEVAVAAKATSVAAQITQPGQYALLLADPSPLNPSAPATGQELAAVTLQTSDISLISTTGRVVPQAAPPSVGLCAAGDLLLVARPDAAAAPAFISGLVVNARVSEKFDLTGGSTLQPAATVQDIILYRTPCATSIAGGATETIFDSAQGPALRTTFPVAPSRDFTIVDLLLGKINIEITQPDTSGGVMVGADGARLLQPDGTSLSIPAGALTGAVPVTVATLPEATVSSLVGADFRLLRGVDIAITGQTLKSSATLSIPAPAGFDPAMPVVVARKFDVKGGSKLKLVSAAKLSGSIINSEPLAPELTNSINSSGQYLFLQAVAPIGYVTGQITDAATAAFAGIQVTAQSATLADLTGINGQYLLALAAGTQSITALDPARGDAASGSVAITANTKSILNLTVRLIPPTVVAITPTNGATNVQPAVPVSVTFSKPMDKTTITNTTLVVRDAANNAVPGVLTYNVDNTTVTFYPSDAFKQETSYNVTVSSTVKDVQGYSLGQDVVSNFTVRKTTAPPMPAAGSISGTFPGADGYITVIATQGSAPVDCTVLLINDTSGEIQSVTPQSNGSFTGKVRGQLGDEIKVVLMDHSGNQTTISYLTFKSPDGSYLVTAKGGKVEGEGGSLLEIPEGALSGAAVIKVTPVQQAGLPSPIQAPGTFLSAFNIDTGGLNFQKEVHLSIPVPSGFDPKTPVFVVKPGEVYNEDGTVEKVFEIIDSTKIINGRITTASPPFDGLMALGGYIFTAFPEVQLGIASGYAYQEMNGLPGYQEAPSRAAWDELMSGTNPVDKMYKYDRPVQGAVVRTPSAWNYVSYTKSSGFYAGFSTLFGNVNAGDMEYRLTATHPQTMRRETVTGYLSADGTSSRNIEKLNFKLADKDTVIPDKTAPAIDFELKLAPGQGASAKLVSGTVTVGSDVQVAISVIDQLMGTANLTVEYRTAEMPTAVQISVQLDQSGKVLYTPAGPGSPAISRYTYTPAFAGDLRGSLSAGNFRPQMAGIYMLTLEATDQTGNKSTKKIEVRAVELGAIPAAVDGPPFVLTISPGDKNTDIRIDTSIQAVFSELVANVNETTFRLFDKATMQPVSAGVSLAVDGGLVRGILVPRANLVYGREYLVRISTAITDASANASADGALLPLFKEITTTFTTTTPKAFDLTANPFSGGRDVALYHDVEASRLYSYVTAGDQGWRAVDVSSADKPEVLWPRPDLGIPSADYKFPYGFFYRGVAVEQQEKLLGMTENITFADGNQYGYLRLYDLSDPKKPVVVGREVLSEAYTGIPGRLAMRGDYAYVSTVGAGLQIVNTKAAIARQSAGGATDGSAIVGAYDTISEFGHPNDIALSGANGVVLTTNSGFLLTFDVTTPEIPMVLGSSRPDSTWYSRVAMANDYVFTSAEGATGVMNLAVVGGRKSVGSAQEGRVFTLDLSDPGNPRQLAIVKDKDGFEVNVSVMDISVNKAAGLAFVAGFVTSGGSTVNAIQVVDIRDPYHPLLISTITHLPDMSVVVPPGGTRPMIPIGSTMALTDLNGWLYLANQPKGVRTIQLVDGPSLASDCYDCKAMMR